MTDARAAWVARRTTRSTPADLDEAERTHLMDLARTASAGGRQRRTSPKQHMRPGVQRILDSIDAPAATQASTAASAAGASRSSRIAVRTAARVSAAGNPVESLSTVRHVERRSVARSMSASVNSQSAR